MGGRLAGARAIDGKVPETLDLPASTGPIPGIVASDEFDRQPGEPRAAVGLAMEPQSR